MSQIFANKAARRLRRYALYTGLLGVCLAEPALAQGEPEKNGILETGADAGFDLVEETPVEGDDSFQESAEIQELLAMPLEDLLTVETTSVAKKRQRVGESAAAVYVITQEDIARSPATTIPELLRMAPGMEVAEIQNGEVGVTARGFNSPLASTLLVLIDGRAIYFSSLSGVLWTQQLLPLSEIERIEIVRGPSAALWGSSAVNGVVNIVSKHSTSSRGLSVSGVASLREQNIRIALNEMVGSDLGYRVYANARRDRGMVDMHGDPITRSTRDFGTGLRLDYEPNATSALTLQADYATGAYGEAARVVNTDLSKIGYSLVDFDNSFSDYSLLLRGSHSRSDANEVRAQFYFEQTNIHLKSLIGKQTTIDAAADAHFALSPRHDLNFGLHLRRNLTKIEDAPTFGFQDDRFNDRRISGYLQDDWWLSPQRLRLTLGTKFEYNTTIGWELQPSVRLLYRPTPGHTVWAAVSRASRTPSLYERAADFHSMVFAPGEGLNPLPIPLFTHELGNAALKSEHMMGFEAGVRGKLPLGWTYDIAAYFNGYQRLVTPQFKGIAPLTGEDPTFTQTSPFPTPAAVASYMFDNGGAASTWGVEGILSGPVTDWWKAELTTSNLFTVDPAPANYLGTSPKHQFAIRNRFDLGERLQASLDYRHVSSLEVGSVPAYDAFDLKVTFQVRGNVELSVIGKNLFTPVHLQYHDPRFPALSACVPRNLGLELKGRF